MKLLRWLAVKPDAAPADPVGMTTRSARLLLLVPLLLACQMPNGGTPVFVDMRAGDFWSGEGKLLEVSDDQKLCRVAVRSRSLVVRDRWVDCAHVHTKSVRHRADAPAYETSPKSSFK
jgi:hypothetical protein